MASFLTCESFISSDNKSLAQHPVQQVSAGLLNRYAPHQWCTDWCDLTECGAVQVVLDPSGDVSCGCQERGWHGLQTDQEDPIQGRGGLPLPKFIPECCGGKDGWHIFHQQALGLQKVNCIRLTASPAFRIVTHGPKEAWDGFPTQACLYIFMLSTM